MMSAIRDNFLISPAILAIFIALNSSSQAAVTTQADRQQASWEQVADAPPQSLAQVSIANFRTSLLDNKT